jgi:hydroxylamine reductase (hybrid-cluster protein)
LSMFCYQCQETARGKGCTVRGVCGKDEVVAKLQDLLIYTLKGISEIVVKGKIGVDKLGDKNYEVHSSLFHLGPTLPGFLSPNVAKVLVEKFGIAGIGTVEGDIELFMAQ